MIVLVFLGGAVGASLRYFVDASVSRRLGRRFPFGVLVANCVASFLLALLTFGLAINAVSGSAMAFWGTGLCGALSTYSTFSFDTVQMLRGAQRVQAVANVVGTTAAGVTCAVLGAGLAAIVWS